MTRLAIPVFQNRVSPVLDSCTHLFLVDIEQGAEKDRKTFYIGEMSLPERCRMFSKLDIGIVICGGVSEAFANMLKGSNIRLFNGIAGDIDDVITAFLGDRLDIPRFYMPGFKPDVT